MKKIFFTILLLVIFVQLNAQTNPAIISWLQNTTVMGSHYVNGNSIVIPDNVLANVQKVEYSNDWVFVTTNGIPAYPTGPFLDGNPSLASDQNAIYKMPLNPAENTGTFTNTNGGNIGIFINGVSLFDYRDGVAWNPNSNALCGGPGNPPCPGGPMASSDWNRDAIPAERDGFDCSKGHPAMGNYHHHQNPSAFKLDITVVSEICNLYDADGLYSIDPSQHSPLIGFAYDGFPIYGAYGYKNFDGTGGIVRMKSGYHLRNITTRTEHANGANVSDGPDVSPTYPLGYFREDYEFISSTDEDILDEHNGRVCKTPEYPEGTYAYFATVDENWNSAYPYVVGPTFFGNVVGSKVTTVDEPVTVYDGTTSVNNMLEDEIGFTVFPNPSQEFIAIQANGLLRNDVNLKLYDLTGKVVREAKITQGSTIWYLDTQTLYNGQYFLEIVNGEQVTSSKIVVAK